MSRVRPEVIIEENLITHHSSPVKINKSPIEIHDANVSFSNESSLSNDNQDQKQQSLKKGRTENEEIEDDGEFEANS